MLRMKMFKEQ